jgi:2-succinyl-5-enolpyruvyl-6-hydroxy-3-cyclohexene-1-carboxylate synthase
MRFDGENANIDKSGSVKSDDEYFDDINEFEEEEVVGLCVEMKHCLLIKVDDVEQNADTNAASTSSSGPAVPVPYAADLTIATATGSDQHASATVAVSRHGIAKIPDHPDGLLAQQWQKRQRQLQQQWQKRQQQWQQQWQKRQQQWQERQQQWQKRQQQWQKQWQKRQQQWQKRQQQRQKRQQRQKLQKGQKRQRLGLEPCTSRGTYSDYPV